jgi:hypothetical protein
MHLWQMAFGLSDASLRMPSLICSLIAPFIVIFSQIPQLSRAEKLTWAALLALWIPGIGFAEDARCYAMLLMFATIQTITFYKLLQTPTFRNTTIWVLSAELTMFGNYDAAYLAIAQGVIFLAMHRRIALKYWPTIFLTLPVLAELAWKWPILSKFERVGTAWYPVLQVTDLPTLFFYPISGLGGVGAAIWVLLFPPLCIAIYIARRLIKQPYQPIISSHLHWVAAASLIGGVTMIAIGFLRPTFTWRYMPPFEPGILLGIVLLARAAARHARAIAYMLLIGIAALTYQMWIMSGAQYWDSASTPLNIEQASDYLMKQGTKNLVFTWDSPTPRVMPLQLLRAVGGFFFERAGVQVNVMPLETHPDENANVALLAAAKPSDASIIWLYDKTIKTTAAITYPPAISIKSPAYHCANFGKEPIGSLACHDKMTLTN